MISHSFVEPYVLYLGVREWHLVVKYAIHKSGETIFRQLIISFNDWGVLNLSYCLDSAVFLYRNWTTKYPDLEIILLYCV